MKFPTERQLQRHRTTFCGGPTRPAKSLAVADSTSTSPHQNRQALSSVSVVYNLIAIIGYEYFITHTHTLFSNSRISCFLKLKKQEMRVRSSQIDLKCRFLPAPDSPVHQKIISWGGGESSISWDWGESGDMENMICMDLLISSFIGFFSLLPGN